MRLFFLLFGILFVGSMHAQQKAVNILVVDSLTTEPLPFANIYLKYSGYGASTNIDGNAQIPKINFASADTIVVSYIGYHSKHLPFDPLTGNQTIQLSSASQLLEEVTVTYKKPLSSIQIIKKSLKNTDENYSTKDEILHCLFREVTDENNRVIQLDEAFVDIYYTGYPKKKLDSKIWKDWYYDDSYAFDLEGNRNVRPLLNDFNTKQDQMKVVASRSSENWSEHGLESTFIRDPLLLTAFDKIKYQYDFLNPRLLKDYNFKKIGLEYVNGTTCYAIQFFPKPSRKRFVIDQSRKNKRAIFIGKLYIEKESFAVTKFEFRLAVDRDYGFFARRMPLDYRIEVNYKKQFDRWRLNTIGYRETRSMGKDVLGRAILHEGAKDLMVIDTEVDNVRPFLKSDILKSTKFTSIRYQNKNYNPAFWKTVNLGEHALENKIISELEIHKPLPEQFAARWALPVKMNAPTIWTSAFEHRYHDQLFPDSLHWMAQPENEREFRSYLNEENKYAKNFLLSDRSYQRKIFDALNNFYVEPESTTSQHKPGSFYYEEDSLQNNILYFQKDPLTRLMVVNTSEFKWRKKDIFIKRITPNPSKTKVFVQYERTGTIGDFVSVLNFGSPETIDSLSNVYKIEWFDDATLIYGSTAINGWSDKLFSHHLTTKEKLLLYQESDLTFDVAVLNQSGHLYCIVQSKSENEIYWIDKFDDHPKLQLIQQRQSDIIYTIKKGKQWYKLTNEKSPNNQLMYSTQSFPFDWKPIFDSDANEEYIRDFVRSENYLIKQVYVRSMPMLKYLKDGTTEWVQFPMPFRGGDFSFRSTVSDTDSIIITKSSPAIPMSTFKLDLPSQKIRKIAQDSAKYAFQLKYIQTDRKWAKSADGTKVPMTIITAKGELKEHKGCILKVYGAYGANTIPYFSAQDAILLNYGFTIVYAHVRGESVLGNTWYQDGKLFQKKHTFEDFIACAKHLIKKKFTTPEYLVAYGNSAGGLVVGWAINEHPQLFNTAILDHAYLDVINTMMDENLPLTTDEYKEWGDPKSKEVFEYIYSYSPYQNIRKQDYPNLIFTASYQDYQTPVWQIAKQVAAIRQRNTSDSNILLLTDMNSSHMGNTTGKEWIKLFANVHSFVNLNLFE